jgi:hypothetical protein
MFIDCFQDKHLLSRLLLILNPTLQQQQQSGRGRRPAPPTGTPKKKRPIIDVVEDNANGATAAQDDE